MFGKKKERESGNFMVMAVLSWIHVWLLFSGSYLLAAGILKYSAKAALRYLADSLWLFVPAVLSWIYIRKIHSLFLYLLGSAAGVTVLWFLSGSLQTAILAGVIFLLRCYARVERGRLEKEMREMPGELGAQIDKELWEIPTFLDEPRPVHWVLFFAFYLGILFSRQYFMLPWMFDLFLAEVFVCFIFSYLHEMNLFIRESQNIANLPINRIRRVGTIILGIAVIFLVLTVLPSLFYGREPLADVMERMYNREIPPGERSEDFSMMGDGGMGGEMDLSALTGEVREPPAWMEFLSKVVTFIGFVGISAGILLGIYRLCRNTAGYFSQEEEDEVMFLGTDEVKGLGRFLGRRRDGGERRGSPDWKIRRTYKKLLRRRMGERPAGWEAPAELEEKAKLSAEETAEKLHVLYEKARYSREDCSAEEAAEAADLAKGISRVR